MHGGSSGTRILMMTRAESMIRARGSQGANGLREDEEEVVRMFLFRDHMVTSSREAGGAVYAKLDHFSGGNYNASKYC